MRHDVIWSNALPPLRADRSVRLWLPFDCHRARCRDPGSRAADLYAETPAGDTSAGKRPRLDCSDKKSMASSNWTMFHAPRTVLGVNCQHSGAREDRDKAFCSNTVNIDWWWAGDTALADTFGSTFDSFGDYSRKVKELLQFHNAAPHHYWGLFFYHTHRLREKCQLGHAGINGIDFTLGRFVPPGTSRQSCRVHGWRPYWKPPPAHGGPASEARGVCNASSIPGYLTMCPEVPTRPLYRTCSATASAQNRTSLSAERALHKIARVGGDKLAQGSKGGGKGGGGVGGAAKASARSSPPGTMKVMGAIIDTGEGGAHSGAAMRPRSAAGGESANTKAPKSAREALKELIALRDEKLISDAEFERLRMGVLDALVARARGGAPP
jgi:hypothetical protein